MTTINPGQSAQLAANFNTAVNGAGLILAAGVMGSYFRPLNAGPLAFASLPSAFAIQFGMLAQGSTDLGALQPSGGFTAQLTGQSTAKVDLGDGYRLEIDERNSQMTIFNEKTGESTKIWGDPHVDVNGKRQFDFYGTTTFQLDNGSKITINTEPYAKNPNEYLASQVVVTKGDNAVVIDGISQNQIGDLSVNVSTNGYALDAATRDGFTVHEAAGGWQTELGTKVTQADANLTKPGQIYGPGSQMPSLAEASQMIESFLLFGAFAAGYQSGMSGSAEASANTAYRPILLV